MDDDLRYWLGFNLVRGIGPVRLRALIDHFGDVRAAWHAPEPALRDLNLDRRALSNLLKVRRAQDLEALQATLARKSIDVLTWASPDYPALLAEIADPPPVLFVCGEITPEDEWAVAVVGTRKVSSYGREVARRLGRELARNGVTVVSGLARGVDGIVHRAVLEAGGRTIAVLGSGVDHIYPPENRDLAIDMGTVVVEAGLRSGALITADFALDQGREVFAVPGNILSPNSAGCNRLLRDGAHVVTEVRDILETLRLDQVPEKQAARITLPETPTEAALFGRLSAEPRHLDELARASGLSVAQVSSTLVMMELKGMVRQAGSNQYVRAFEPATPYVVDRDQGPGDTA